ncbi:DUF4181 domain-containing protein [Bacillus tianshenii]|nr:DUF4181 domain-containing protein [Bacillus tianshenii]
MEAVVVAFVLYIMLIDYLCSKWLIGDKKVQLTETKGELIFRWGVGILVAFGASTAVLIATVPNFINFRTFVWIAASYLIVSYSFRAWLEWRYVKKTKQYVVSLVVMAFGVLSIIGMSYINEQMAYTSFSEVVDEKLNEDTTIEWVTIHINDLSGRFPEREAGTTIKDRETIERLIEDFSNMELKKEEQGREEQKYRVGIVVRNQVDEDHYSTEMIHLLVDENKLRIPKLDSGRFEIISETNHLKTIEALIESKEVEWERGAN